MILEDLFKVIEDRQDNPTENSYTAKLISMGEDEIIKKIGEEAMEVIIASKSQGNQRLIEEISDLYYHTLVLLAYKNLSPTHIQEELEKRHKLK